MHLITVLLLLAQLIAGKFVISEPVVTEIQTNDTVIIEESQKPTPPIVVQAPAINEEVIPVVQMTDQQGVVANVPLIPPVSSPTPEQIENNWALFWELNPNLLTK